jgi:hypothetical protein
VKENLIKCRFCKWQTHKWGRGSNPAKAFARLRNHIEDAHPAEDDRLTEATLLADVSAEEKVESYRRTA